MKIEIRYISKSGNTKKAADKIAETLNIEAKTVNEPVDGADILFLGGALYAGKIHKKLKIFIESLDDKVKKVAVFGTSATENSIYPEVKKHLDEKGVPVFNDNFQCPGKFLFICRKRPNAEDLENAAVFARKIIQEN